MENISGRGEQRVELYIQVPRQQARPSVLQFRMGNNNNSLDILATAETKALPSNISCA